MTGDGFPLRVSRALLYEQQIADAILAGDSAGAAAAVHSPVEPVSDVAPLRGRP